MFKPNQKFIDMFFEALDKGTLEQLKSNDADFLDGIDLSNPEIMDSLKALVETKRFENIDLSGIKIPHETYLLGDSPYVESWTDTVIWPNDMSVNPQQILEDAKHPTEMDALHTQGFTGKGIAIAIIDQRLYLDHPEYKDRIKHYEMVGHWPKAKDTTDYHGSLVTGCAVGKTTGTAPDADVYYIAANNWPIKEDVPYIKAIEKALNEPLKMGHRYNVIMAIKRILEINKTLPENEKIRFLSCSWGSEQDQLREQCDELFAECERNGIMVIGGFYKPNRNKTRPSTKTGKTIDAKGQDVTEKLKTDSGIPTDRKTTPYFKGGYIYKKLGGSSSTFPYIAGVFACACQGNQIFFTRPNWQDELFQILTQTSITDANGGKMINPIGIRERVTQIAREMEMNLIQQQSLQHE